MNRELFTIPEACPTCGGPVEEDGSFLFCRSRSCPSRLSGSVKVWVAHLGLLHWGDSLVESLTDAANAKVSSVADLYKLSVEDIAAHCSGMKFAKKCHDILHSNKSLKLELIISSLNIPNLGISTASDIVSAGYDTVDKVLAMSEEDLVKIPNIGPVTASQVYSGIQDRADIIKDIATVVEVIGPSHGPLSGMSFCVTGSTKIPRKALHKRIMDAGGIVKESVIAGLSYLVTNEDLSSFSSGKAKKAMSNGTKILSELDVIKMIESPLV